MGTHWARRAAVAGGIALAVVLAGPGAFAKDGSAKVIKIRGSEYTFLGAPKTVTPGKHTLEFTNVGGEHHEMGLAKLNSGVTLDAFLAASEQQRDTMGDLIGSVHIEKGGAGIVGTLTYNFKPGHYALICADKTADGTPHYAKGMRAEFDVKK
jgi:plastocyanin